MDNFIKVTAMVFVAIVLHQVLSKRDKDIAVLLCAAACCIVLFCAMTYLEPVLSFFRQLQSIGKMDTDIIAILLKCAGIGLLAEVSALICTDTGNAALGKSLQILAVTVILWMSVPMFSALLELLETILGET